MGITDIKQIQEIICGIFTKITLINIRHLKLKSTWFLSLEIQELKCQEFSSSFNL